MKNLSYVIKYWLPLAVVITLFSGLVYATVQQNYRQSANDPQIQMAEDAASELAFGGGPYGVLPRGNIDIAKSIAPFMIIYDENKNPIISKN